MSCLTIVEVFVSQFWEPGDEPGLRNWLLYIKSVNPGVVLFGVKFQIESMQG